MPHELTSAQATASGPLGMAFVRTWLPSITMMMLTTLSYIDRNTLAILAPTILAQTGLKQVEYGFVISGFSVAYMLGNPIWGRIVDRIGVRVSMTGAVLLWTLASVSHALAGGVRGFLAARTMLGIGEAAAYPGGLRVVTQSLSASRRMRGVALAYSGGSLGAIITPILVTPLAAAWGWRAAFWATGVLGLLWLGLWAVVSRRPDLALPRAADVPTASRMSWNDRRVWAFMSLYALGSSPLAFVLYQSSLYLHSALHKSQLEIGQVLWIPPLSWEAGFFFWGWVTDRISQTTRWWAQLRALFLVQTLLALPLALTPYLQSFSITLAMLSLAMFVAAGMTVGGIAYGTKQYSVDRSGLIAGLSSGAFSAVVALEMPVIGMLFDLHAYVAAFALAALLPLAGYLVWRMLDGKLPQHDEERAPA